MKTIKNILDREIKYVEYDTSMNWSADLPIDNWSLIIITDEMNTTAFDEILKKSIDRNVGYICGIGKQHELIHIMADAEIQNRELEHSNHMPNHFIITVSDENFENGLWSDIYASFNPETDIKEIIILDTTNNYFEKTVNLIEKFHAGYIPEE